MRIAKFLLSSAAAAIMATAAFAAHAQAPTTGGALPAFNWTGPYIGINAGDDFDGATRTDRTTGQLPNNTSALTLNLRPTSHAVHGSGFTGGAQVGYNYELGNRFSWGGAGMVIGAEADAQYTDIHRTDTLSNTTNYGPLDTPGTTPTTRINQYQGDLDFLGTVRGRVGFAYNTMLIYGTGARTPRRRPTSRAKATA
jgi:outer membrane immunogenic protein